MAWLSGLADKAENLLNKIDKNTAAVLNKDKYEVSQPVLTDVTWISSESRFSSSESASARQETPRHLSYVNSTPNLPLLTTDIPPPPKDEELLTFLNTPDISPTRLVTDALMSPPSPSSLFVEHPTDTTDSVSEMSMHSNCSSSHFDESVVAEDDIENFVVNANSDSFDKDDAQVLDNGTVNNQYREISHTNGYIPQENGVHDVRRKETANLLGSSNIKQTKSYNKTERFEENTELLQKQETDHQKQIMVLNEKLHALEMEKLHSSKQVVELQSALERSRLEVYSTRSELEQHKARAMKTLQEKEKLIAELRGNESTQIDDTAAMELNQLRQEREILREENLQISEQLKLVREELMNTDIKLEKMRQKSNDTNAQAQEILATERRRRLDAEEDAKVHSEEVRALKDELLRQRNTYTTQLQKQDSEIARLRMQLSTTSAPSGEMESRLATLTKTLVLKQQALESLTTERNALRLQLEKIEHEFRNMRRNAAVYNNMNDTDDAKAQVPVFLLETPFDTGVTRRVKRAYSTLDAISIRTGVFLRRYPLARILVLIYMGLLQFWVLVVLLSQSPEAH